MDCFFLSKTLATISRMYASRYDSSPLKFPWLWRYIPPTSHASWISCCLCRHFKGFSANYPFSFLWKDERLICIYVTEKCGEIQLKDLHILKTLKWFLQLMEASCKVKNWTYVCPISCARMRRVLKPIAPLLTV